MPNALHRKDGSEQNLTNQDRRAKCLNFNVSKEKFVKDEVSPSLEQQTKNSFKVSIIPQKKDEDKLLENKKNRELMICIGRFTVTRA